MLDNPAPFENPLQFEITFECLQALEDGAYNNCVLSVDETGNLFFDLNTIHYTLYTIQYTSLSKHFSSRCYI